MLEILEWSRLDAAARDAALVRPARVDDPELAAEVLRIVADVRARGDAAVREQSARYDGIAPDELFASPAEFAAAASSVPSSVRDAIEDCRARIERFHAAQRMPATRVETARGVVCWRETRPIRRVGLYVPAGSAPLPSTALMLGVPARLVGCEEITLATPPRRDGRADPAVLCAARACGIERVLKVGGAQAIAALAYGTASISKCDKLFGPGNVWVTAAKQQVARDPNGAAIDLPAGPSELLVIADRSADPNWIAADLLSQAEHGADSQVILVTPEPELARRTRRAVAAGLADLPRADLARAALAQSRVLLTRDLDEAFAVANAYAPEHLSLALRDAAAWTPRVSAAGSVFVGHYAAEAIGDYASGTNHVLPTYGWARAISGLSLAAFATEITFQSVTAGGLAALAPATVALARVEGLEGHARAVERRLARRAAVAS